MPHKLVQMITDDDGLEYPNDYWHFIRATDAERTLCTGECFGEGESIATFETKVVARGGITCPECMKEIKRIKAIKL